MRQITIEEIKDLLLEQQRPMTSKEACKHLGVTLSTLYKYTHGKRIPFYKPTGRKNYFLKSDLDAFLLGKRSSTLEELDTQACNIIVNGGK